MRGDHIACKTCSADQEPILTWDEIVAMLKKYVCQISPEEQCCNFIGPLKDILAMPDKTDEQKAMAAYELGRVTALISYTERPELSYNLVKGLIKRLYGVDAVYPQKLNDSDLKSINYEDVVTLFKMSKTKTNEGTYIDGPAVMNTIRSIARTPDERDIALFLCGRSSALLSLVADPVDTAKAAKMFWADLARNKKQDAEESNACKNDER